MLKQITAAALLSTAFMASPVLAQTSTAPAAPSVAAPAGGKFMTQMSANEWRGSKLVGVDVYGTDNAKIGDINEVIVDRSGSVKAIVIGVGGFLGLGQKDVAVPYDMVEWTRGDTAGSMSTSATAPADANRTGGMASTTTNSANAPATTGATRETTAATGARTGMMDYPERAMVRMSKQDLQNAPEFKYASDVETRAPNASGTAPATTR